MEPQKRFEELKKKFNLPSYEELDKEYDLGPIEDMSNPLKDIRDGMTDKIEAYSKIMEEVIQPDTNSFRSMSECRVFSEEDKHHIFAVFRKLMMILRTSQILGLECDDKKDIEFIRSVHKDWSEMKKDLLPFLQKLKHSWEKDFEARETLGYMG